MMGFTETSMRDHRFEPFTLAESPRKACRSFIKPFAELVGLTDRETRMLRLASPALVECLGPPQGERRPAP